MKKALKPGRAPTPRKMDARLARSREAILTSARRLFLDVGYEITTEEVAAAASVTKRTLYNHYPSKRHLLEAVLQGERDRYRVIAPNYQPNDLRALLDHYAWMHEHFIVNEENMKLYRLLATEVARIPDLALEEYERGVAQVVGRLARRLEKGVEAGWVRPVNVQTMAERFYAALTGLSQRRALAGIPVQSAAARRRYLEETVDLFAVALTPGASHT